MKHRSRGESACTSIALASAEPLLMLSRWRDGLKPLDRAPGKPLSRHRLSGLSAPCLCSPLLLLGSAMYFFCLSVYLFFFFLPFSLPVFTFFCLLLFYLHLLICVIFSALSSISFVLSLFYPFFLSPFLFVFFFSLSLFLFFIHFVYLEIIPYFSSTWLPCLLPLA